jgi:ubiquinone/menaquinone biosynthesis C-methylase UbiE
MSIGSRIFAFTYDRFIDKTEKAGLRDFRERLLTGAAGSVLEIGSGTGLNLPCYGPAVRSLTMTEPEAPMLHRLRRRASELAPAATVLRAPAEDLPFDDNTFDVAVSTLVLCGVDDQPRALRELRRVLRPGGRLLFIEHVRADDPAGARMQDRMNWLNRLVVHCDCNRPTLAAMQDAGFTIARVEHTTMPKAPKFVSPTVIGSAVAPASARQVELGGEQGSGEQGSGEQGSGEQGSGEQGSGEQGSGEQGSGGAVAAQRRAV